MSAALGTTASPAAYGTWLSYGGAGRIGLAAVLFAAAAALGVAAARGWPPRRSGPDRPRRRAVTVALIAGWVLAAVAVLAGAAVYVHQARQQYSGGTAASDPITPVTLIGAGVVFLAIFITSRRPFPVTLAGAVIGAMAGPVLFELPFDVIVMARTYPPVDPHPDAYRIVFFAPLFAIELVTLALLARSPMVRPGPAFGGLLAVMLALFAVWALAGFGYPSAPLPIALNVAAKLAALAAALSLFLPPVPATDSGRAVLDPLMDVARPGRGVD
jgi:hypothetical protein